MTNKYASIFGEHPSEPNTKLQKETQLNNISGTVFNLNMLVMQYSLIRNNLIYTFEAIGAPCWLTMLCVSLRKC